MPLIELTELAHGGDAVGHVDAKGERRAVFVRGGAVGDRVELDIDFSKRPARGQLLRVVEPGHDRVEPPCPYAGKGCGGCDWMHVSHEGQLKAHAAHVREAVGIEPVAIFPATKTERYREHARLHAKVKKGRAIVGPNEGRSNDPLYVDACLVLDPRLDAARSRVAELLEGADGSGEIGLALGANNPVMELRWSRDLPGAFFGRLEAQVQTKVWDGARVWIEGARTPAVVGNPMPWIRGIDGLPLRLAPGGFAQAHAEMNDALGKWVAERSGEDKLLELYAGAGNFTVLFAKRNAQVTAVESDSAACEAAQFNLKERGLRATVVCSNADERPIDAPTVVLDPPRTGARAVCESIAKSKAKRVIYVSCDPPSLKRDLAILAERFEVREAALFEMFPHTSHVETAVLLTRRKK